MLKKIWYFVLFILTLVSFQYYQTGAISNNFFNINDQIGTWYGKGSSATRIWNASIWDLDYARTTYWLTWNINSEFWVKWKQFIWWVNLDPSLTYGGADINGDTRQDLFYIKWGKWYLIDLVSGNIIWETKVYGMNKILWVEWVLWVNKKKQIVFVFWDNPFYVWILDGRTWEMITNSKTWWSLWDSWTYSPNYIRDKQADGSVIYTLSCWRSPLIGITISADWLNAKVTPSYENRYKASNGSTNISSTDDYSWNVRKMTLGWKTYFLISDSGTVYIMDPSQKHINSIWSDYSMKNYHTYSISPIVSHGYNNNIYDLNNDGNDEYILWRNEIWNYYQKTKMWVWWLDNGSIKNFWWLSWPLGTTISKVIPIKNTTNANDSYVAVKLTWATKYQFYKAFWSGSIGYTSNISLGSNSDTSIVWFNESLWFEYDTSTYGDILWIFDNWQGTDYIVTRDGSNIYHFFLFNGNTTFQSPASVQITGTQYDFQDKNLSNYGLKYWQWEVKGWDINGNGIREFATAEWSYFKHYEINNNQKTLVSEIEYNTSENTQYSSRTRQYTFNGKDVWTYRYNSTDNTIKIYKTNTTWGQNSFTHLTQNFSIYSLWQTSPISIFKHNSKNYLHFWHWVYDGTTASPNTSPTKITTISNDSHFIDMDGNQTMNLIEWWKVYNLDANFGKSVLYNNYGLVWDFNGDHILDRVYTYKDGDDFYKYYAISWVDGSQIYPAISTSNTSCWPAMFNSMRLTQSDKDDLIIGNSWCGHQSRIINPSWNLVYTLNHMHTIQIFDIDGDGIKDMFWQDNNYWRYYLQASKIWVWSYTTLFNTPIYSSLQWDIWWVVTSVNRSSNGNVNFWVKWLRGEIISVNSLGQILFRSHYYDGERYTGGESSIFESGWVPLDFADVIVWDINGDGNNEIIAWWMDGWVYIIHISTGDIIYKYNVGTSIMNMALGNADNDWLLNIVISAQDGYVYRLNSSNILWPNWVKDGWEYDSDIEMLAEDNKASLNFEAVTWASWYFVQLYNNTKKSPVFDWVNIGNITTACIRSNTVVDANCIASPTSFNLTNRSVYEWRVQAYNTIVTSPITKSNWFIVTTENGYYTSEETEEESTGSSSQWIENEYTQKNLKVFGNGLPIILNIDNTPIKNVKKVDVVLTQKEYKIVMNNQKTIQGSGSVLSQIISNYNCKNILMNGGSKWDGIYVITISGWDTFNVYCDMTTDGWWWTLIALSNTSKNTFWKNLNRASPFVDFYKNEVDTIENTTLSDELTWSVLKYERRKDLISYSTQTMVKWIKWTSDFSVINTKLNFWNRMVSSNERLSWKFCWDSQTNTYINNNFWRTSLQTWWNNCWRIENIPSLTKNDLITSQKVGINYEWCLSTAPSSPIWLGRFIR